MKTQQVLGIREGGIHIICLKTSYSVNPYRVYRIDFGHRCQIAKYGDFTSVLCYIRDLYFFGANSLTMTELVNWSKERGALGDTRRKHREAV